MQVRHTSLPVLRNTANGEMAKWCHVISATCLQSLPLCAPFPSIHRHTLSRICTCASIICIAPIVVHRSLIRKLLVKDPKDRLTASQALVNPWFEKVMQLRPFIIRLLFHFHFIRVFDSEGRRPLHIGIFDINHSGTFVGLGGVSLLSPVLLRPPCVIGYRMGEVGCLENSVRTYTCIAMGEETKYGFIDLMRQLEHGGNLKYSSFSFQGYNSGFSLA